MVCVWKDRAEHGEWYACDGVVGIGDESHTCEGTCCYMCFSCHKICLVRIIFLSLRCYSNLM